MHCLFHCICPHAGTRVCIHMMWHISAGATLYRCFSFLDYKAYTSVPWFYNARSQAAPPVTCPVYTHTHIHVCIYTHTCVHICRTDIDRHYGYARAPSSAHHTGLYRGLGQQRRLDRSDIYMYIYIYIYIYYICIYIYIYIYIYIIYMSPAPRPLSLLYLNYLRARAAVPTRLTGILFNVVGLRYLYGTNTSEVFALCT